MDLKKEIKLSDLLKRAPKEPKVVVEAAAPEAEVPAAEPKAKRLSLSAGRAPKAPKVKREKAFAAGRDGAATPEIPLMRAFNLLPKQDGRDARHARPRAQLVLAVVGVLLLAGVGGAYVVTGAGVSDKRGTRDVLQTQLETLQAQAAKAGRLPDPALASEKNLRTYALESALSGRIAWDRLLREVSLVLPEDVWLTGLASTPPETAVDPSAPPVPSTVIVSGYARAQDGVAHMLSRLALVPELSSVQLVSSQTTLIGETEVFQFQISALVKLPESGAA